MTHIGILCPAATGHLNPMTALGRELITRGHQVTVFGLVDARTKTLAAGLNFCGIGESLFPVGSTAMRLTELGKLSGIAAFKYTINQMLNESYAVLTEAPSLLKRGGVEILLVDQAISEGGTIAEFLDIPFISVCNALLLNREDDVPPIVTPWNYNSAWWARLRNNTGYALISILTRSLREVIEEYRRKWKLPQYNFYPNDFYSKLAQLSQQPELFEFPRKLLPNYFHFTGPYHNAASRNAVPFPYENLTGQPLIYASLGTVQNRLMKIFSCIAEACNGLDVQLVISLGGGYKLSSLPNLPGKPLVVEYAPQLELLKKATLTITHAGMNTTLESLSNGVPMVAIPITNDQPGVAARIAWTETGEVVPLKSLSVPKLRNAITKVLAVNSYKKNALRLQEAIENSGGLSRAADIIEQVISTKEPVLR
ncbi:MAG: glycosyltransferase [Aphanothece sp. CMT-3BRIN-NPC111]|jgi:MGT family glycosyltransferase|nr:glycosyltransferase [Aphanothece sp. CMT-3BRIN-NPC111]